MTTRGFSAYNLARGVLLNSRLTLAESGNQPLKLLDIVVSGMGMDPAAGLWLSPLHAIPAVPRVFPFDIIYLDKEYRVLDTAEMGPGIAFPAFHPEVTSALVLPPDTLRRTHTALNDGLIVCVSNELESLLAASSLQSPNTAGTVKAFPVSAASPPGIADNHSVGEFAREQPAAPLSAPTTAFEQSILTAVAKVAETRSALEAKQELGGRGTVDPGPSLDIAETVRNPHREIQPAIIEHRIDPEDLFSNWVVTAPPAPLRGRTPPPEPAIPRKPEALAEEPRPEPIKQNGRKPSASTKPAAELPEQARTASTASTPPKTQARAKPAGSDKAVTAGKAKTSVPDKSDEPGKLRAALPATPIASTFTTVPYGMWQVTMPTAVASMTGAKSPAPARHSETSNEANRAKQATPLTPSAPEKAEKLQATTPPVSSSAAPQAAPVAASTSPVKADSAPVESLPRTGQIATPPKPVLRDSPDTEAHKPGDFVATLKEKLQRAQQSKPLPASMPEILSEAHHESSTASSGSAASELAPSPADPIKSAALPSFRSEPAHPDIAKPKAEAASGSFRSKFKHWLIPGSSPSDRRRANRRYVPGVVAHYFTGGAPKPNSVADISMSGMYLLTDDRWMPGTMIQMTLQKPCAQGEKKQSINVLSRIVRRGSDGVAVEFVMPEALSHISHDIQPSQATDKVALARFL